MGVVVCVSVTKHLPPQEVAAGGGWGDIQALTLLY